MNFNPVRITFWHRSPAPAKRSLVWHTEDYWSGVHQRHCVWWNENFGINGAWDDTGCNVTMTNNDQTTCECSLFGPFAVMYLHLLTALHFNFNVRHLIRPICHISPFYPTSVFHAMKIFEEITVR
jgi:hypothetical protein